MIDDVWSGGSKVASKYPLMSTAIAVGLYHPRCKDGHTTYFEEISTPQEGTWTKTEISNVKKANAQETKHQYAKRQAEKFGRLSTYSLSPENKKQYKKKADAWEDKITKKYSISDEIKKYRTDTPDKMVSLVDKYTEDEFIH